MEIRRAMTVAELAAAEHLFDHPVRTEWAERFLTSPGHHLYLAYEPAEATPVGFVSGVETVHPDKGAEMLLYELGVAESYRRGGIGRALVRRLAEVSRERGCYGMWVPVDTDNEVALATYRSAGGKDDGECAVVGWELPQNPGGVRQFGSTDL
ncbi:GNAT family N-acetyltransferase [Streptomyces sp. SID12488]|uniref:GNAT family N-acetyltransferase n=1 Tax=Streptomyces sp. SID12488 TaxID=2706040 RepID=UPI0013D9102A|nr:GNAT family N-acetyltransferase [Streptomyces sp. SID12488]